MREDGRGPVRRRALPRCRPPRAPGSAACSGPPGTPQPPVNQGRFTCVVLHGEGLAVSVQGRRAPGTSRMAARKPAGRQVRKPVGEGRRLIAGHTPVPSRCRRVHPRGNAPRTGLLRRDRARTRPPRGRGPAHVSRTTSRRADAPGSASASRSRRAHVMAAIEGTSAGFQGTDGVLYSTTPGELMEKARDITATQASVQAELAALHNYVMGLAPIWGGVAALAFQRLMGDWDTHATKLQEALLGIAQGLQSTADNYVQGEHANLTNLNNISLPPARLS